MEEDDTYKQGEGVGVCWSLRVWSVSVISILLLSTCFIGSCVVTYQFVMNKPKTKLSELHAYHSSLTCFSEGTRVSEKMWGCCPSNWKSFGSSCYLISTKENIWSISERKCIEMGAHLAVINTEAEQNFITQQLNKSVAYFLGLSDPRGNGNWQWIDNTPFNQNVRFWHIHEPNLPEERCASIVYWHPMQWGWNDVFCDGKYNSICEMKKTYL
ncbi:C-type lectin domain family 6 member A [Phodopus roborovskii]|uniref:C-type lectin domain family 6 member A n=1 Tax=Phodopus roborovskii TaxID=109678 RepID=UPI0021E37209|nr:C-type lectin domain family 6 member A [Phodopus roborovskii]